MRSWSDALILSCYLVGVLPAAGCDETLPSYREPGAVLEGRMEARYTLTASENRVGIIVTAVNRYEESLEGRRVLSGQVEIRSKRRPELRKTLTISPTQLIYARFNNNQTGTVRIDPGDSVRFLIVWNLAGEDTPEGNDFLGLFTYYIDPACPGPPPGPTRNIAFRETFILSGELKVFEQSAPALLGPVEFSFCRVSRWIEPNICPTVDQQLCPGQ